MAGISFLPTPSLNYYLGPERGKAWNGKAIFKAVLGRLVLYAALIHGFPQMLIAFSAMELGTRLHDEKGNEITNTYFLIKNPLSLFPAMVCAIITAGLWKS